jgi:hexosaminidase
VVGDYIPNHSSAVPTVSNGQKSSVTIFLHAANLIKTLSRFHPNGYFSRQKRKTSRQMKSIAPLLSTAIAFLVMACQPVPKAVRPVEIIPQPVQLTVREAPDFILKSSTPVIISDSTMLPAVEQLQRTTKMNLRVNLTGNRPPGKKAILFQYNPALDSLTDEGYTLTIGQNQVSVQSSGAAGLFYAVETIRQLLPVTAEKDTLPALALPAVTIVDKPRFSWRGMHLDVSRHFMPVGFIKKYIDYLAMHKLNVFHWHLVDGIGWRIEIKSHPRLTQWGAWRVVKPGKMPWQDFEIWKPGDPRPRYGGFYTQEQIKEVVAYAKKRFVTVVPEIELPGHSEVVFQCYPQLLCKDKNGQRLPNTGVYCASNPAGYKLLEDVIDEVVQLFPSTYIHIGGDEVNKSNWRKCASCRRLMRQKHLTLNGLQSYLVNHFDRYLKSKGRKLIGWHEILQGNLSPSASIMYWGGEDGVKRVLDKGHPTVLTTGSCLYFDHYQSLSANEPKAFGGYAPLKKVYDYEPLPKNATPADAARLMGVQANVWTEYMPNPRQVEYMVFPRIAALAEIAWQQEGMKNWNRFRTKVVRMLSRYKALGINYAPSAYRPAISFSVNPGDKKLKVKITTELPAHIIYTTDGSDPTVKNGIRYTHPFLLNRSATVKAISVIDSIPLVKPEIKKAIVHKARGAEVVLRSRPTARYSAQGGKTLTDLDFGGDKWGNGKWIGVIGKDFDAIVKLDSTMRVHEVGLNCLEDSGAGIRFPVGMDVWLSIDGRHYQHVRSWKQEEPADPKRSPEIKVKTFRLDFPARACRYIRVKAKYARVPHQGVFIFADEIEVY